MSYILLKVDLCNEIFMKILVWLFNPGLIPISSTAYYSTLPCCFFHFFNRLLLFFLLSNSLFVLVIFFTKFMEEKTSHKLFEQLTEFLLLIL